MRRPVASHSHTARITTYRVPVLRCTEYKYSCSLYVVGHRRAGLHSRLRLWQLPACRSCTHSCGMYSISRCLSFEIRITTTKTCWTHRPHHTPMARWMRRPHRRHRRRHRPSAGGEARRRQFSYRLSIPRTACTVVTGRTSFLNNLVVSDVLLRSTNQAHGACMPHRLRRR